MQIANYALGQLIAIIVLLLAIVLMVLKGFNIELALIAALALARLT